MRDIERRAAFRSRSIRSSPSSCARNIGVIQSRERPGGAHVAARPFAPAGNKRRNGLGRDSGTADGLSPSASSSAASAATVRWSSNWRALRRIPLPLARAAIWNKWIESGAEGEQVAVAADAVYLENFRPDRGQRLFERRLRRCERSLLRRVRPGQRGAIEFPVRRHRQGVEPHPD